VGGGDQHHDNETGVPVNRRFEDTMSGKIVRFWPLILALITLVGWLSTLAESVSEHHKIDDARCRLFDEEIQTSRNKITALEVIVAGFRDDLKELKVGQKELLRRVR
jgi:hypothetical protein